jgi:hypothetical protein
MVIDHLGAYLLPQFFILRIVGRFSFPLFAYFISLGIARSHSKVQYFLRLWAFGIISQLVLWWFYPSWRESGQANILFLFALCLCLFILIDWVVRDISGIGDIWVFLLRLILVGVGGAIAYFFKFEYGAYGIFLCAAIYYRSLFLWFLAGGLALFIPHQWLVFPFFLFLSDLDKLPNGKPVYAFYWLYPAHLALIGVMI